MCFVGDGMNHREKSPMMQATDFAVLIASSMGMSPQPSRRVRFTDERLLLPRKSIGDELSIAT